MLDLLKKTELGLHLQQVFQIRPPCLVGFLLLTIADLEAVDPPQEHDPKASKPG